MVSVDRRVVNHWPTEALTALAGTIVFADATRCFSMTDTSIGSTANGTAGGYSAPPVCAIDSESTKPARVLVDEPAANGADKTVFLISDRHSPVPHRGGNLDTRCPLDVGAPHSRLGYLIGPVHQLADLLNERTVVGRAGGQQIHISHCRGDCQGSLLSRWSSNPATCSLCTLRGGAAATEK